MVKRWTTALIALPFILILFVYGNKYIVDVAFAAIAAIALHEFFVSIKEKANPVIWIGYLASISIAFIHIIPYNQVLNVISIMIPTIILLLFIQVIATRMKTNLNDISVTFFGICYITIFIMFIPIIHGMDNGKFLVWYLLCASWGGDSFAYFFGRLFGKHKFSKISPNKTIEGCIGGIIGTIIFTVLFTILFNTCFDANISYMPLIVIQIVLSILGQIGDFAASSIKRYVGIKDYSQLIPGHGGMLDRIDSLLFIAPFAYILFNIGGLF